MAQIKIYGHADHLNAHRTAISDAIHACAMTERGYGDWPCFVSSSKVEEQKGEIARFLPVKAQRIFFGM